jgi:hypothetical protein
MKKNWKRNLGFGLLGLIITSLVVSYQIVTNGTAPAPLPLLVLFIALCPTSVLSIPFIDAEVGTSGFYFIWTFIGLLNALLYAGIGAMIAGRRKKSV